MFLIPASSLQLIWTSTAQSGVLRAPSAGCWFFLPHLISNSSDTIWLNFLCTELYNCSTFTFLWASEIATIQPIHGQGYILIFLDRMHLLFILVHFLFWELGRGQYATSWNIEVLVFNSSFQPQIQRWAGGIDTEEMREGNRVRRTESKKRHEHYSDDAEDRPEDR